MTDDVEVFLDETPGETRGVIRRNGRYQRLLIQRDDDEPSHRLEARSIGRIIEINPGLKGAFVDLGTDRPGFLPLPPKLRLHQGEGIEVVVTAEPREAKGVTLRRLGSGTGEPRLLQPAHDVRTLLIRAAPDVEILSGVEAIDAAVEVEEEALAEHFVFQAGGLDLSLERTRALVSVDFDHRPPAGRDGAAARAAANGEGLRHTARLLALKELGGLVVIDMIGDGREGEAMLRQAREAFAGVPSVAFGPVSRFGLVQLALPWRRRPIAERLCDGRGALTLQSRAITLIREMRRRLLINTAAPRIVAHAAPDVAVVAQHHLARLGPRAGLVPQPGLAASEVRFEEI
ncbi:ribonuclease E/G [Brevundimonas sp. PAMC22021]|uniref:ribonuclease E/G n=1 Tax=Brevundimonas sp. PAMC22021 TaxID=2861285 RepID=UPI001C632367|nr:ribonuclease E/G [Brevundimonas sp. PAMC22021]QYF87767.1 ribonuclease E/G [Brevundimonas sp. PAMC22021]